MTAYAQLHDRPPTHPGEPKPEPVTPDFASMTMSSTSISFAFTIGTSASSAAVG